MIPALTSLAGATPSENDGPTVEPEVVMTSPPGAGDEEWDSYINEYILQITPEIPSYDNPGGLAIEGCYPDGDIEVCLSSSSDVYYGSKDCGGGQTPSLYWTDLTASVTKDGIFQLEVQFWIGINPVDYCLMVGNESAGICKTLGCKLREKREDLNNGDPTPFTLPFVSKKDWVQDNPSIITSTGGATTVRATPAAIIAAAGAAAAFAIENTIPN